MNRQSLLQLTGLTGMALSALASASEGGGSSYPLGAETYMAGAMPPPGMYGQVFVSHYEADSFRGNDGRKLPMDFDLRADCIAARFIWVTEQQVLGGQLGFHVIAPLVDVKVSVNDQSQSKS